MIKNFLIISFTGKNNKLGLKIDNNFFVHNFQSKTNNNGNLVLSISKFINEHKANLNENFSILINVGPGSYSSIRIAIAVAKGIKISHNINLYGFKDNDLSQFNLENIDILINKNLLEKNLLKPIYLS